MTFPSKVPNPGSQEAINAGCICAIYDNYHGEGFYYGGTEKCFWITQGCPVHDPDALVLPGDEHPYP